MSRLRQVVVPIAFVAAVAAATEAPPAPAPASTPARGEDPGAAPPSQLPPLAELERDGYRIGRVHLGLGKVFDESRPGERFVLFRLANRLHRTTRPWVVERLLLFRPGDPLSAARIAESERLLRAERSFYDAAIRPARIDGDRVDLEVETRDVWSLNAGIEFHRSGGANSSGFKLQDTNLLGLGKEVALRYESNPDRNEIFAHYLDRNLFGSRARLELEAGDASDGREARIVFGRPFFSLDTRWGAGLELRDSELVDSRYELGQVSDRFQRRRRLVELWAGWSHGREGSSTHRMTAGLTWDQNRFVPPPGSFDPVGGLVPPERELLYPWTGWEWIEDGYVVGRDLDKIQRSEDLNLGAQAGVRLGFAPDGSGTSGSQAIVSAHYRDGTALGARNLLLVSADLAGRFGRGGADDLMASIVVRDFLSDFGHGKLVLSLRAELAHRLAPDRQLLLGGDTGLRGYPLRYQQGDRLLLATIEQRFYDDRELFHLFRVGASAFVDVGKAWFADRNDAVGTQLGLLRDLGVGLRIGSSRSARAAMVHLDLAMPLDGPRDISRLQWLVTTGETF